MKKLLSLALCLVMLMSMMSGLMVTAAAEDNGVVDAELTSTPALPIWRRKSPATSPPK